MSVMQQIKDRWSPRAFSTRQLSPEDINIILEAASLAPSSMNEQPWRYYYSFRGETGFDKMLACLLPGNSDWAKEAPVLILSVAEKNFKYKNRPNRHAIHDTGASNAFLSLQAASLGFQVHQMGGFDNARTIQTFNLDPETTVPVTFMAVGYPGDPENLSADLKEMEISPRTRSSLNEFSKHFK